MSARAPAFSMYLSENFRLLILQFFLSILLYTNELWKMEFRDSHPFISLAGLPQTRPSLRRVSSSVLHVCGAKIAKNYQMQHFFCKQVVGIENNSYLCTVTIN